MTSALSTGETKQQVQRRLLGHIVVGQGAGVLQLLAPEGEALLVGRDALLVLDLLFHGLEGRSKVGGGMTRVKAGRV